jgi:hypothetical protein
LNHSAYIRTSSDEKRSTFDEGEAGNKPEVGRGGEATRSSTASGSDVEAPFVDDATLKADSLLLQRGDDDGTTCEVRSLSSVRLTAVAELVLLDLGRTSGGRVN